MIRSLLLLHLFENGPNTMADIDGIESKPMDWSTEPNGSIDPSNRMDWSIESNEMGRSIVSNWMIASNRFESNGRTFPSNRIKNKLIDRIEPFYLIHRIQRIIDRTTDRPTADLNNKLNKRQNHPAVPLSSQNPFRNPPAYRRKTARRVRRYDLTTRIWLPYRKRGPGSAGW